MNEQPTDPRGEKTVGGVPHGVEALLIEASIDPEFRKLLLQSRADAGKKIGLDLTPAEAAMLNGIPEAQLELAIRQTRVSKKLRAQRRKRVAGVALAALGVGAMKLGCDRWVEYERERQMECLRQLVQTYSVCIAGMQYRQHLLGYGYEYPVAEPSAPDDLAGAGERQAKELGDNGE